MEHGPSMDKITETPLGPGSSRNMAHPSTLVNISLSPQVLRRLDGTVPCSPAVTVSDVGQVAGEEILVRLNPEQELVARLDSAQEAVGR